jgi:uncharacterized protein (DUF1501 family)
MRRSRRFCDGSIRRDFLRIGAASLFGASFALPRMLAAASNRSASDVSLIYLYLKGGLSTIDTWDLKPDAPAEFRGEFKPMATAVPGIQICELMPRTAKQMPRFSLVRSFRHHNSDHGPADHYMLTGYFPAAGFNPGLNPNNQRPALGSIISRKLGPRGAVPPFVCLPKQHPSTGPAYLGASAAPFVIDADPNAPDFVVPDVLPPAVVPADRLDDRRGLLQRLDRYQKANESRANAAAGAVGVFRQKAFVLMTSADAKRAFDIHSETAKLRDEYGRTSIGQCCLMARRLVEAGVRCVTIDHSNYDTHDDNFKTLRGGLLPNLDAALSTLFRDLEDRGLLQSTLVLVTGEFGRTPRINPRAGRDHWGPAFTVAIGGGGIQGGRVVGRSDARAERPATTPFGPEDLCATICHQMGIDPKDEFLTPEGRPVAVVNNGRIIGELL